MGVGYGYGGYGAAGAASGVDNRFIRLAEENSRPAFETIQSIVNTFGSISMMFESTYYALHSSFRFNLTFSLRTLQGGLGSRVFCLFG